MTPTFWLTSRTEESGDFEQVEFPTREQADAALRQKLAENPEDAELGIKHYVKEYQ